MTTGDSTDGRIDQTPAGLVAADTARGRDIEKIKTLVSEAGGKARELDALLLELVELLERGDANP